MRRFPALLLAAALWPRTALAGQPAEVALPVAQANGGAAAEAAKSAAEEAAKSAAKSVAAEAGRPAPPACRLRERVIPIDAAAAAPLQLGLETYPQTLALAEREVVLTFDDGPGPATTPAVLAALREARVHATFFLIGRNAAAHRGLVEEEVAAGHSVGHHSMTHPAATLRGLDGADAEHDIDAGIAADERAAYGPDASPAHPHVPFFRFPGFADTAPLLARLAERGIAVFGADLWAADWLMMTPDAERARVLALLQRRPRHNGIILFHDTKKQTARMLPALLADLCREGYGVAHLVPRAGAAAPALVAPKPWHSQTEAILARAHPHPGGEGRGEGRSGAAEGAPPDSKPAGSGP